MIDTKDLEDYVLELSKMMDNEDHVSQTWSGNYVLARGLLAMTQRLDRVIDLLEKEQQQTQ